MTLPERAAFYKQHICQMALLLPKIECQHHLIFGTGNPEQQLQAVVDAVAEFCLASFWDDARVRHGNLMISLETMQPARYPPGHYMGLALAMNLTSEQQITLKTSWNKAKSLKAGYESAYDQVAQQLAQLQQQQLDRQVAFAQQAEVLPTRQRPHWWQMQQQQQSQASSSEQSSGQSSGRQSSGQSSEQQQQQQQLQRVKSEPDHGPVPPAGSASAGDVGTMLPIKASLSVPAAAACPTGSLISSVSLVSSIPLVASSEQQQLEQRLDKIARQLKVLLQMQSLMLFNTLTAKQIATGHVLSWPLLIDSFNAFEAFEHLHGWNL